MKLSQHGSQARHAHVHHIDQRFFQGKEQALMKPVAKKLRHNADVRGRVVVAVHAAPRLRISDYPLPRCKAGGLVARKKSQEAAGNALF